MACFDMIDRGPINTTTLIQSALPPQSTGPTVLVTANRGVLELELMDFSTESRYSSCPCQFRHHHLGAYIAHITHLGLLPSLATMLVSSANKNMDLEDPDLQHQIYRMPLQLYSIN
jgi:hypothetical protein